MKRVEVQQNYLLAREKEVLELAGFIRLATFLHSFMSSLSAQLGLQTLLAEG